MVEEKEEDESSADAFLERNSAAPRYCMWSFGSAKSVLGFPKMALD